MGDITNNLRIVHENHAIKSTISASSEVANYFASNMQKRGKTKTWQSSTVQSTVTAAFTEPKIVSCVSFPFCNFFNQATLTISLYPDLVTNTPSLVIPETLCCEYSPSQASYNSGQPISFSNAGGTYATVYFSEGTYQKVEILVKDISNQNGKLESAYLVIGQYWSPKINAEYGAKIEYLDTSKHARNGAGDVMTDQGFINKQITFDLGWMEKEDRQKIIELGFSNGINPLIHCSVFPESEYKHQQQTFQIYGFNKSNTSLSRRVFLTDKTSFKIQEI